MSKPGTYDYITKGEVNMPDRPSIKMSLQNNGAWNYEGETKGSIAYGTNEYSINSDYQLVLYFSFWVISFKKLLYLTLNYYSLIFMYYIFIYF